MKLKHSPGPWKVIDRKPSPVPGVLNPNFARWAIFAGDETDSRGPSAICDQSIEADARLIGAAPELLEALEHALADLRALGGRVLLAERAIAKAKGEIK